MRIPDISNLDYAELNQLRAEVTERMREMRDTGITQLRATIAEQAQLLGVDSRTWCQGKPAGVEGKMVTTITNLHRNQII